MRRGLVRPEGESETLGLKRRDETRRKAGGGERRYVTFKDLFEPIISSRHNGYGINDTQPTDMDINKISDIDIDPFNKYVLTTRVRTGRSVRGFKLPPLIGFDERRKLEAACVEATPRSASGRAGCCRGRCACALLLGPVRAVGLRTEQCAVVGQAPCGLFYA